MTVISVIFGCINGTASAVGEAAIEGAEAAVGFCISVGSMICLWSAAMELMRRCGIASLLSELLSPVLRRLFPEYADDPAVMEPLSANVSANLLGLGNAATPMGIRAAKAMTARSEGSAPDALCRFVVLNTASIQLLPTTAAAIRASCGAAVPFDIIPAVLISSAVSVAAGLSAARVFAGVSRK